MLLQLTYPGASAGSNVIIKIPVRSKRATENYMLRILRNMSQVRVSVQVSNPGGGGPENQARARRDD